MGGTKVGGAILMVVAVLALVAALLLLFSSAAVLPASMEGDRDRLGVIAAAAGVGLLVFGVILMMVGRTKKAPLPAGVPMAAPQQVEIKRTEMNWASSATKSPADELQTRLDAVNQKMGQAKVKFGMGELSNESYKMLMADYEKEKAEVERAILAQQDS